MGTPISRHPVVFPSSPAVSVRVLHTSVGQKKAELQQTMPTNVLRVDSLVDVVTSNGPFRGLRGAILQVDTIEALPDEPFGFYLVALEGIQIKDPVWFECEEVEPATPLSVAP